MSEQRPSDRELTPEEQAIEASLLTSQGEATLFALEQFHQSKQELFELVDNAMRGEIEASPSTAITIGEHIDSVACDYAAAVITEEDPVEQVHFSVELFYGSVLQIKDLFEKYEAPEVILIVGVDEIQEAIADRLDGVSLIETNILLHDLLGTTYTEALQRLLQHAR